jgi:acetyltransferase-like isoleucine patch superfamily enzyme
VRNGTSGPELGKEINIGEDCWLGGNVIVLPGVTIGRGATIGAGSVVTRVRTSQSDDSSVADRYSQDVPAFHVAAGNPARVLKKIRTAMDTSSPTVPDPSSEANNDAAKVVSATSAPPLDHKDESI